eukprot:CAMPEP_0177695958 /NCGR_PEP_ID=MMETSP0484_2-20121128/3732_1 /TAXON_ID=354590 /ORGANISM="Rhodomonas lens, Strain RHODO" /LENGTH=465 /DNA_ID=CAMNT_0019206913 /DNA_START=132 /DNA_END=1529 /DNA_ORIENTATION=-
MQTNLCKMTASLFFFALIHLFSSYEARSLGLVLETRVLSHAPHAGNRPMPGPLSSRSFDYVRLRLRGGASDDKDSEEVESEDQFAVENETDTNFDVRKFGMQPLPEEPEEDKEKSKTEYLSRDSFIGRWGWTALHRAASAGDAETLGKMISMGGDVNAQTQSGWSPLHEAAAWGRVDAAKLLIDSGARVNQTNKNDWTALHFAAGSGQVAMVKLLLDAGIDREAQDNYGDRALDKALRSAQVQWPCCPPGLDIDLSPEARRAVYLEAVELLSPNGERKRKDTAQAGGGPNEMDSIRGENEAIAGDDYEPCQDRFDVYAKLLPGRRYAYDLDGLQNASYVDSASAWMDEDADAHGNFRVRQEDEDEINWEEVREAAAAAEDATELTQLLDDLLEKEEEEEEAPPTGAIDGVRDEEVKGLLAAWKDDEYEKRTSGKDLDQAKRQEMWERDMPKAAPGDKLEPPTLAD